MVGDLWRIRERAALLGQRADRGFPTDSEHGQWLRDVVLCLIDGLCEAAAEGAPCYSDGRLDRLVAEVSTIPLPRL